MSRLLSRLRWLVGRLLRYARTGTGMLILVGTVSACVFAILVVDSTRHRVGLIGMILAVTGPAFVVASRGPGTRRPAARPAARAATKATTPRPPIPSVRPDRPDVSVVVTAFNDAAHIEDCLRSVRRQRGVEWECIVMDDHSTDDTIDRVKSLVGKDPRFVVFTGDRNAGLSRQRNAGVEMSRAEVIAFLDGDDFYYPGSLHSRFRELRRRPHPALAGVYCRWESVPENAPLSDTVPEGRPVNKVTWFNTLVDGVPFIVTSPLLYKDAFTVVGGFHDVAVSEDVDLWQRVLRAGFFFRGIPRVGVAYRQRAGSMLRRMPTESARVIASLVGRQTMPLGDPDLRGPFVLRQPFQSYLEPMVRVRRLIGALAFEVTAGRDHAPVLAEIEEHAQPFMEWLIGYSWIANRTSGRATMPRGDEGPQQKEIESRIKEILQPLVDHSRAVAARWREDPAPHPALDTGSAPRRQVSRRARLPVPSGASPFAGKVVIVPSAGYHVVEAGPLAESLAAAGVGSAFLVGDRWWPGVAAAVGGYDVPIYPIDEAIGALGDAAALVTFNDWGPDLRAVTVAADERGVPTFAKVEGAQDFGDVDTGRRRDAYRTASRVLAQGGNDVAALAGRPTTIVGSTRLERIWLEEPRIAPEHPVAVINLNFTYGVLTEARDLWLATAIEACRRIGLPFVVSRHPAEKASLDASIPIADQPMRHLLTTATLLISRFSTVPFEAMARGVPFVYHNPHGEQVAAFSEPHGAFRISTDTDQLADSLTDALGQASDYRSRCEAFFRAQVDVDPTTPSEDRGAAAILAALG